MSDPTQAIPAVSAAVGASAEVTRPDAITSETPEENL